MYGKLSIFVSAFVITAGGCKYSLEKPNILLIMADDLGYSDLGCYGGEIRTPHLDQLAEKGIRFTQFYNSARCCPSRASLLTGLYPHQAGIGSFVGGDRGVPGYAGRLTSNTVTLAEVLKEVGYRTFGVGKWHVNYPGPTERGFEEWYGFLEDYGIDSWRPKWMQRYPEGREERAYEPGEFFATDVMTDYALDFLELAEDTRDNPWFMFISYQAPHFPLQAPAEDINRYRDTYTVGWDTIRARRFERMKKIGVVEPNIQLSERSQHVRPNIAIRNEVPGDGVHVPAWNMLDSDRQADLARRMAVYAGMVDNMDQNIGRVIKYLKETGQLDNTLILFMSDNGACGEWDAFGFEYPERDARVAGHTPGFPNVLHKGEDLEKLGLSGGPLFSYGSGWSNAGNTPFSLHKMFVHEGGISSPLIMHWPAKIKKPEIFKKHYAHFNDLMATFVEITGAEYPQIYKGNQITPMEGVSLFETLKGNVDTERILTFEHSGHPAIRKGDWKLVSRQNNSLTRNGFSDEAVFELYNILEDRSETNNLASEYTEKAKQLKDLMEQEFHRTQVFPRP